MPLPRVFLNFLLLLLLHRVQIFLLLLTTLSASCRHVDLQYRQKTERSMQWGSRLTHY